MRASTAANGGAALPDRLIQRRERERLPQHLPQSRASGRSARATAPPFRQGTPRRGSSSALCPLPSALSARSESAARCLSAASSIAPPSASQSNSPPRRLNGAGSGGSRRRLFTPVAIDELDIQIWLHQDAILCAKLPQKRERLVVTSHQHVLAVVDPLAGLRIAEGRRPAAEHGLGLEHQHLCATRGKLQQRPSAPRHQRRSRSRLAFIGPTSFDGHHDFHPGRRRNHRLSWP